MSATQHYSTVDMVRALPDNGKRYEVVHGELLVSPGPTLRHQHVSGRFFRRLSEYLDADARAVEVWIPDAESPVVERDRLIWLAPGASAPLEFVLDAVFAP